MGNDAPLEALKVQAVAARSEAVIALTSKLYSGEYYDLTSNVEFQVVGGNQKRCNVFIISPFSLRLKKLKIR
jgi:peptidoglycan hydrolase-like amidase